MQVKILPMKLFRIMFADDQLTIKTSKMTSYEKLYIYSMQASYRLNKMSLGNLKAFAIPILIAIYIISGNSKPDAVRIGIENALGFLQQYFF